MLFSLEIYRKKRENTIKFKLIRKTGIQTRTDHSHVKNVDKKSNRKNGGLFFLNRLIICNVTEVCAVIFLFFSIFKHTTKLCLFLCIKMEPIFFIVSDFELKVLLFFFFETKMAADYLTKGIMYIIADLLSLITVALCMVQKLPQIQEIFTYKSAKGKFDNKLQQTPHIHDLRWKFSVHF